MSLGGDTAQFLRTKETNMREIVGKAYTELGRELTETQTELAGNRYNGVFEKWYTYLGFSKQSVYNYIHYYAEVKQLDSKKDVETFESLPKGLAYNISAPSAESTPAKAQAKAEVLAGYITTGKAYKDRIAELETQLEEKDARNKQTQEQRDAEQRERERLEIENSELAELCDQDFETEGSSCELRYNCV